MEINYQNFWMRFLFQHWSALSLNSIFISKKQKTLSSFSKNRYVSKSNMQAKEFSSRKFQAIGEVRNWIRAGRPCAMCVFNTNYYFFLWRSANRPTVKVGVCMWPAVCVWVWNNESNLLLVMRNWKSSTIETK